MDYYSRQNLLMCTMSLPVIAGGYRYRMLDGSTRLLYIFLILTWAVEGLAYIAAVRYHNNLPVYNLGNILQTFLLALYFNRTISIFRKRDLGIAIGIISVLVGALNLMFLQPIDKITSNFLVYQAIVIISMSMLSLSQLVIGNSDHRLDIFTQVRFWIATILIFFWSLTCLFFMIIEYYTHTGQKPPALIIDALYWINVLVGLSFALVFIRYPKMDRHE